MEKTIRKGGEMFMVGANPHPRANPHPQPQTTLTPSPSPCAQGEGSRLATRSLASGVSTPDAAPAFPGNTPLALRTGRGVRGEDSCGANLPGLAHSHQAWEISPQALRPRETVTPSLTRWPRPGQPAPCG
jgi:hypothetical protein